MSESILAQISGGKRRELDFYPTPPLATVAILPHIKHFPDPIWECACGDGSMSKILGHEFRVVGSDIENRGCGLAGIDFLQMNEMLGGSKSIVTNPPFNLAHQFITHMHKLNVQHIALLLKADFWNAKVRRELFDMRPPSKILGLTWRLDFTGAGRPHRNCIWCIWDENYSGTKYELLGKPNG